MLLHDFAQKLRIVHSRLLLTICIIWLIFVNLTFQLRDLTVKLTFCTLWNTILKIRVVHIVDRNTSLLFAQFTFCHFFIISARPCMENFRRRRRIVMCRFRLLDKQILPRPSAVKLLVNHFVGFFILFCWQHIPSLIRYINI